MELPRRRSARGLPAQAPTYLLLERGYKKERFDPTARAENDDEEVPTMSNVRYYNSRPNLRDRNNFEFILDETKNGDVKVKEAF